MDAVKCCMCIGTLAELGGRQLSRKARALPHALDGRIVRDVGEEPHARQIFDFKMTTQLGLG